MKSSGSEYYSYRSLFLKSVVDLGVLFDTHERNILWELGRNGPHTIYQLTRRMKKADLPSKEEAEVSVSYYRDFVSKVVNQLKEKGAVKTYTDVGNKRKPTIVELSLEGLILYLRESEDKERFNQAVKNYARYLPFSENWEMLNSKMGQGSVHNALEQAVKNCVNLRQSVFRIRPLDLEFQGVVEDTYVFGDSFKILNGRNEKTAKLLQTQQASVLRDSYIAYLAVHDMLRLRNKSRERIEELIPSLNSERELSSFEGRSVGTNSLFKGERLREFFPKYADLEYFLTGMFVQNLLWNSVSIGEKIEESAYEVRLSY